MEDKTSKGSEPSWLDLSNGRKTPYSDAELDRLTDDQIAMLADTPAWRNLVADVGTQRAREVAKEWLARRDPNSLVNWTRPPAQIDGQVLGCDALEARHPAIRPLVQEFTFWMW